MFKKAALFSVGVMLLASAAFAGPDKKAKTTQVNTCPVSGKAVSDSKNTGVYGKYTVHFCCDMCKPGFDKLSKKEQQAKIATAMKPAKKKADAGGGAKLVAVNVCPITGEAVSGEGGGKVVYGKYEVHFCCAGCKAPFEQLTAAEKDQKIKDALKKG